MENIKMPIIGESTTNLIIHEITSIEPLSQDDFLKLIEQRKAHYAKFAKFGSIYPSWMSPHIFDGISFIPADQFIRWFGKDKIIKSRREIYRKMRDIL